MRKLAERIGAALASIIGVEECVLTLGLILLSAGLWPVFGRAALVAPGLVLIWLAIPSRRAFIHRPVTPERRKRA